MPHGNRAPRRAVTKHVDDVPEGRRRGRRDDGDDEQHGGHATDRFRPHEPDPGGERAERDGREGQPDRAEIRRRDREAGYVVKPPMMPVPKNWRMRRDRSPSPVPDGDGGDDAEEECAHHVDGGHDERVRLSPGDQGDRDPDRRSHRTAPGDEARVGPGEGGCGRHSLRLARSRHRGRAGCSASPSAVADGRPYSRDPCCGRALPQRTGKEITVNVALLIIVIVAIVLAILGGLNAALNWLLWVAVIVGVLRSSRSSSGCCAETPDTTGGRSATDVPPPLQRRGAPPLPNRDIIVLECETRYSSIAEGTAMTFEKWVVHPGETRVIDLDVIRTLKISLVGGQIDVVAHDEPGARIEVHSVTQKDLRIEADGDRVEIDHPQLRWTTSSRYSRASAPPAARRRSRSRCRAMSPSRSGSSARARSSRVSSPTRGSTPSGRHHRRRGERRLTVKRGLRRCADPGDDGEPQREQRLRRCRGDRRAAKGHDRHRVGREPSSTPKAACTRSLSTPSVAGHDPPRRRPARHYVVRSVSGRVLIDGILRSGQGSGPTTNYAGSIGELSGTFADIRANTVSGDVTVLRRATGAATEDER